MKRIYFTKGVGIIFMLLAMVFGCTQVSENLNENNSGAENKPSNDTTPITVTLIGADGTELKVINATAGERVLLSSVSVENLSHWNTAADGSGLSYKGAAVFSESVTLYAILLAKNAHVINYMLGGGMNNPQNPYSFTEDDFVSLKNPTRDGYTFAGWYKNKTFTGKAIKGWAAGDKTTDVTLYAKWEKENLEEPKQPQQPVSKITITFDANGGTKATPEAIKAISGKSVELPEMGDNFSHWNTKSDGSGESYQENGIFTANTTLYAIYLQKYKIIYYLNGGKNHPQNIDSFTESDYDVKVNSPTRDGYIFAGWYYNKDFSGERITWITEYEHKRNHAQADITLYAKWEKVKEPGIYLSVGYSEFYWAMGTNGNAYFMTKGNGEVYTYTFRAEKIRPFPDGFKFTTENGWMEQYQAYNKEKPTTDFTMLNPDEEVEVYYATKAEIKAIDTDGNQNATRFKVKETLLFKIGNEYTVTFDKTNMKVKITGDFGEVGSIITIPDGVTYISDSAFSNCDGLTNIIIPDSITSIGNNAFSNCSNLTNVTIGKNVTSIGDSFDYCEELTSLTVAAGNTTYKSYENCIYTKDGQTLVVAARGLTNITILDGVTSIGNSVFSNCYRLTSIIIPDSVTSIGDNAFSNCGKLTSVTIGDGVTSIGDSSFSDCNGLTSIIIPDSVTSIGDNAFSNCGKLTSVTIGDGVTSIGSRAFGNCRSLTTVNYRGTQEQWETITIGSYNTLLKRATINYDYTGE